MKFMTSPPGIQFYDNATGKVMKYIYPDSGHWAAGWIVYKGRYEQWVTLRKATDEDRLAIDKAVSEAHHAD